MAAEFVYLAMDQTDSKETFRFDVPVSCYTDMDHVLSAETEIMGAVIGTTDPQTAESVLIALRGRPQTSVKPIFLLSPMAGNAANLADGVADSVEAAYRKAKEIDNRLKGLDNSLFADRDATIFRLLAFLYARPHFSFEPVQHWSYPALYRFPLVDSILGDDENSGIWLNNLVDRNLLKQGSLKDRIRLCPECEHAHLNYVDVCPNCTSIDITQKPFLHCFACGHVSTEEAFIEKGYLGCPNCNTRLRHIGADYDRALESYSCNSCGHVFEEPEVTAHCQHCATRSKPKDLLPHSVYQFEITEQGIAAVKTGLLEDVYALLDSLNNVNPSFFEAILDWMLKLNHRHEDVTFSLIGIRLLNVLELTETIGRRRVTELMDGFVGRIRELIRTTDLTTRTSRQNFWILLPKTDDAGSGVVLSRIAETQQNTRQQEGVALEINTVCFCAPNDSQEGESAALLLARLTGELD